MIDINKLKRVDKGRWVAYIDSNFPDKWEIGRIKSWNNTCIHVVYKCNEEWGNYKNYTGVATDPEELYYL